MSHVQEIFASLLDMKPVITVRQGVVELAQKVRTRKRALERVLELTAEAVGVEKPINAAVMHTGVAEEATEFLRIGERTFDCQELMLGEAGIALVANGGPGIVGLVAYRVDLQYRLGKEP